MKDFIEWLNEATPQYHPQDIHQRGSPAFPRGPNLEFIEQWAMKQPRGNDPTQSLHNIASNAPNARQTPPGGYEMLKVLMQMGFADGNEFFRWQERIGKDFLEHLKQQKQAADVQRR